MANPLSSVGSYSLGAFSGIIGAAIGANSEIFQFRWASTAKLALIKRVSVSASVSTTFFAAGVPVQIDLVRSTAWSAAGTGGTAITPAALLKLRSSMQSTAVATGDIRIATTAALGAGTKTLDTYPLAAHAAAGPITGSLNGGIFSSDLFFANLAAGDEPLTLAASEGFSIRAVAVPGTGTWTVSVRVDWLEAINY